MDNFQISENSNGNNYEMSDIVCMLGQTASLVKSNSASTAAILADLDTQKNLIGHVATELTNVNNSVSSLNDRMLNIEQSEEITTTQNENILTASKRRLFEIIGNDEYEIHKYYRIFAKRLYSDARKSAGMGSKISRTRKRDYQRVLDYIEAWEPINGCTALKYDADVKAAARKMAQKNGYEC